MNNNFHNNQGQKSGTTQNNGGQNQAHRSSFPHGGSSGQGQTHRPGGQQSGVTGMNQPHRPVGQHGGNSHQGQNYRSGQHSGHFGQNSQSRSFNQPSGSSVQSAQNQSVGIGKQMPKMDNYLRTDIVFYCKDCNKKVSVSPVGRKFVYRCNICKTKNVAFGSEKSMKNFYHIEEEENVTTDGNANAQNKEAEKENKVEEKK